VSYAVLADVSVEVDGAAGVFFVLGLFVVWVCGVALAVSGTASAMSYPVETWQRAGARRSRWAWQAIGAFAMPLALVYSGIYFLRIRPRLVAADGDRLVTTMQTYPHVTRSTFVFDSQARVQIRIPWSSRLLSLLPAVPLFFLAGLIFSSDQQTRDVILIPCLLIVVLVQSLAMPSWFGVDLTASTAIVRGYRRRSIPWSEVAGVGPANRGNGRRVVLETNAGKRIMLFAPVAGFPFGGRSRYEHDLHTIGQWWLDHRDIQV
jgi:hypothetical protein